VGLEACGAFGEAGRRAEISVLGVGAEALTEVTLGHLCHGGNRELCLLLLLVALVRKARYFSR
jgi:hypothetical protein